MWLRDRLGLLVTLMVTLILAIASVGSAAVNPEGERLAAALQEMKPHMQLQGDYTIKVDATAARAAGVGEDAIQVALDMAELNNEVVANGVLNADTPKIRALSQKFEPFFRLIVEGQLESQVSIQAEACGGGPDNPHYCPPRVTSNLEWSTRQGVVDYLLLYGYHKTADYASNYNADDYSKVVDAYGCNWGPFRAQAIVFQKANGMWTYSHQTPEPNPEILSYSWPATWWGTYVRWWHLEYC